MEVSSALQKVYWHVDVCRVMCHQWAQLPITLDADLPTHENWLTGAARQHGSAQDVGCWPIGKIDIERQIVFDELINHHRCGLLLHEAEGTFKPSNTCG